MFKQFITAVILMISVSYAAYATSDKNVISENGEIISEELIQNEIVSFEASKELAEYPGNERRRQDCAVVARLSSWTSRNPAVIEQCFLRDRRGRLVKTCIVSSSGGITCY